MPTPEERDLLVQAHILTGFDGFFFLGQHARRISIASQQARAFNLVISLLEGGGIDPKAKYAIIGAGITGLTVAAALTAKNIDVTVFDANDDIAHKQKYQYRFVHPHVNFWPQEPHLSFTDFPFLNWMAGDAEQVRNQIISDFQLVRQELEEAGKLNRKCEIKEIKADAKQNWVAIAKDAIEYGPYFGIFFCTGFSDERDISPGQSYWLTEGAWVQGRPISGKDLSKCRSLISGCGDGALIDLFQATFRRTEFKSGKLYGELIDAIEKNEDVYKRISEFEQKLIETDRNGSTRPDTQSSMIYDFYDDGSLFPGSIKALIEKVVHPVLPTVTLLHKTKYPYVITASPINRYLLRLLLEIRQDKIIPKQGILNFKTGNISYVGKRKKTSLARHFDVITIRHGVETAKFPRIQKFKKAQIKEIETRHRMLDWYSVKQHWSKESFDRNYQPPVAVATFQQRYEYHSRQLQNLMNREYEGVDAITPMFEEELIRISLRPAHAFKARRYAGRRLFDFGIQLGPTTPIRPHSKMKEEEEAFAHRNIADAHLNKDHLRNCWALAFYHVRSKSLKTSTVGPLIPTISPRSDSLSCYNVETDLLDNRKLEFYVITASFAEKIIPTRIKLAKNDGSAPRHFLTFVPTPRLSAEMPPQYQKIAGIAAPRVEMEVFKQGVGTGYTSGRIVNIGLFRRVMTSSGQTLAYRGLFVIEGTNRTFSDSGDSGAAIFDVKTKSLIGLVLGGSDGQTVAISVQGSFKDHWARVDEPEIRWT
jgi:hypothetical protein